MRPIISIAALVFSTGVASAETTHAPPVQTHDGPTPAIVGGDQAETCQFPTSVMLYAGGALCTGTLVDPEVVLYAAHCGDSFTEIHFGESFASIARSVPVDFCETFTDDSQVGPSDYAFCKLAQPVEDIPITPVAYGCETEMLRSGQPVTIAGFGADEQGSAGIKRWASTEIFGSFGDMISVGETGVSAWQGDSGGPAFVRVSDGTWRAFGIVSGGTEPGSPVFYVRMDRVVGWVEERSGVDITPCHDADGSWQATPECAGFATSLSAGGSWASGCGGDTLRAGYSATCGTAYVTDEVAPTVQIMSPAAGAEYADGPTEVVIEVAADDDSSGVKRVWLELPGVDTPPELTEPPFRFTATFPDGDYEVRAGAEDREGNVGESARVPFTVGEGCATGGSGGAPWGLALLGVMLVLRRRRR